MTKFTGGDNLTGLEKYYHLTMMKNELCDGMNAYGLSFANTNNSGLSFGGNQMDLANNKQARTMFMSIMNDATDSQGNLLFNDKELISIAINLTVKGKAPEKVFDDHYLSRINAILASPSGRTKLDEIYVEEIKERANYINQIIDKITLETTKSFYNKLFGRMLLFDYHNQYYISVGGTLENYLNGHEIVTHNGNKLKVTNMYTFQDHVAFIHGLKYVSSSMANLNDANRRMGNIILILCQEFFPQDKDELVDCLCSKGIKTRNYINECMNIANMSAIAVNFV